MVNLRILASGLALLAAASTGPAAPAAAAGVYVLPPFVVAADSHPWRYAAIPGYEILSRCSDGRTDAFIRAMVRGDLIRRWLLPPSELRTLPTPNLVILFDGAAEAGPEGPAPAEVKRREDSDWQPLWGSDQGPGLSDRYQADDLDTTADAVNLQSVSLSAWSHDGVTFFGSKSFEFAIRHRAPLYPRWLVAGFFGPNRLKFGCRISRIGSVLNSRDFAAAHWVDDTQTERLRQKGATPPALLPMAAIFAPLSRSGPAPSALWSAEASLFVRWGLLGDGEAASAQRPAFWSFVGRAAERPVTEADFRDCFGFGYAEMQRRLGEYLPRAVQAGISLPYHGPQAQSPELRDAAPAEIGRILGEWERIEAAALKTKDPAASSALLQASERTLLKAYAAGSRDPQLLGALGLCERALGRDAQARPFLEAAAAAQIARPSAYLALAEIRRNQGAPLSGIIEPLETARQQKPALLTAYRLEKALAGGSSHPAEGRLAALLADGARDFWIEGP